MSTVRTRAAGAPLDRVDGLEKVTGTAAYAFEQATGPPAYLYPLEATIAAGRITGIDTSAATAEPGVLAVLTFENAPKLASADDAELAILQSGQVAFRGQFIGGIIAETSEIACHAASRVRFDYEERECELEMRADRTALYAPERVNAGFAADTIVGDVDAALTAAAVTLDATYTTPMEYASPMEPHATIATWTGDGLTMCCGTQGAHPLRATVAAVFGLDPQQVHVISPCVGGGFGAKFGVHADVVLAVMAAQRVAGRPVKLALTRQQMFTQAGYRPPSIQRIRLAAGPGGRLTAISHDVVQPTSKIKEFAEQTGAAARMMYAAPHRRTTHRLAPLDVPVPSMMRAPGEAPGMFALESAMDEMAFACGLDPIEFRIRNEPDADPESGLPFSSRHLVACLREGARRFGWEARDPAPRAQRERGWLVGTGVAAATCPAYLGPGNTVPAGTVPAARLEASVQTPGNPGAGRFATHSFGAQFAEVRVHAETGEVRVPRLLGVFSVGRIINPKTGRSQLLGGMTMGLSMALHEHSVLDPRFGHIVNHDFAGYHIAASADVGSIEVAWLDEEDPYSDPMGSNGIGELGIVGTAAAIANAVHHAIGIRVRNLPITLDKLWQ
jgi:xanthine dehydrogenase YagR molybdenum-binding subunit